MRFSVCGPCLVLAMAGLAQGQISPGRQVLLNRGLQIQSLGFISSTPAAPTNYSLWASANFTTFNSWNDTNSEKTLGWTMPWSRWIKTDGSNPLTTNESTKNLSEMVSLQYGDELNQDAGGNLEAGSISTLASNFATWHSQYGNNFLAYTNFGANNASTAMTPAGLSTYMRQAQPDMLMFDAYPNQYVTMSSWYSTMQEYRQAALAGNDGTGTQPIPYAQYLDLYRSSYSDALPSESFIRFQEFASWAFGYTFVTGFVYNKPNNVTVYPTMFASDGDTQTTAVFNEVAEANRESLNLGSALVRLVSTDVRMIPGTGDTLPSGISQWARGAGGNSYITAITPEKSAGGKSSTNYNDIIIGYFQPLLSDNSDDPFADGTHFMLVNGASTGSAASQAQWYHLTFDFGQTDFNSLELLSRDTGDVVDVPLTPLGGSDYSLDWQLDGGTGDLFRFATTVPEIRSTWAIGLLGILLAFRPRSCHRAQITS